MSRHGSKRSRPAELVPGTVSCISVRMDYWPQDAADAAAALADGSIGYVSRYALGRDYHKVLRARLQRLCDRIQEAVGPFGYRVFTDSAPVLEKALARNAGLGWIGKHTNLIDRNAGSYFFLGEIYLNLEAAGRRSRAARTAAPAAPACRPVPPAPSSRPTGSMRVAAFPTSPSSLRAASRSSSAAPSAIASTDATIASWSARGTNSRAPPRKRISRFATDSIMRSSSSCSPGARRNSWNKTSGSAIRRIGYERWLRNVAVALGNAPTSLEVIAAPQRAVRSIPPPWCASTCSWALAQHATPQARSSSSGQQTAAGGIEKMPAAARLGDLGEQLLIVAVAVHRINGR